MGRRLKMAGSQLNVSACCRSCSIDCSSGCGSPARTPGHTLALTPPADVLGLRAPGHSVGEGSSKACASRAAGHGRQRHSDHARAIPCTSVSVPHSRALEQLESGETGAAKRGACGS